MDSIHIRDLRVRCLVGIRDWERVKKQDVIINIRLDADLSKPGRTDRIEDTIDYKTLKDRIVELAEHTQFSLVETMAERIAQLCLKSPAVRAVEVTADKPGALRFARSVGVTIRRAQGNG